jgi:predicted ATPase
MALLARRCYGAGVARELIGREIELGAALTAFATLPAVVAIEGEAGIGKTSVWRAVLDQLEARDNAVLSARPAEAETHLSYAGLADLLDPVLDDTLAELPAPQRQALEAALLRAEPEGRAPIRRRSHSRFSARSGMRHAIGV